MMENKKGQTTGILTGLLATVAVFAVVIIMASISGDVVNQVRNTQVENSTARNISDNGLSGFNKLSSSSRTSVW